VGCENYDCNMNKSKQISKPKIQNTIAKTNSVKQAPVSYGNKVKTPKPAMRTNADRSITIKHTEYIGEISGSTNFNVSAYTIQPGISTTFPWLCNMSTLYESYTVNEMSFSFKTAKSTATNGSVMLAVDYDVTDAPPPSKVQLMSYAGAVRSSPWMNTDYICKRSDLQKMKTRYVRSGLVANSDLKTFDVGTFYIATQGNADTTVIGELYVSYNITLQTPQFDLANFASRGSNYSFASAGITNALLLGNAPTMNVTGSGMSMGYNTSTGVFTFTEPGQYLVQFIVTCTAPPTGTAAVTMSGGSQVSAIQVSVNNLCVITYTVNVINANDTMTFSGLAFSTPTFTRMRIASYPYGL